MDNIKEKLRQIKHIDNLITAKQEQLARLRADAEKVTVILNPNKVQTSLSNDNLSNTVIKIVALQEEINKNIDCLVDLKIEITNKINQLDNVEYKTLLIEKYLNFKNTEELAEILHYSRRNIERIECIAIELLKKLS